MAVENCGSEDQGTVGLKTNKELFCPAENAEDKTLYLTPREAIHGVFFCIKKGRDFSQPNVGKVGYTSLKLRSCLD